MNNKKNIIIATGGTGGHVFPALSIAQYFNDNNYKVLLTTDDRGAKLLQNCNLKYTKINSGKSLKSINQF